LDYDAIDDVWRMKDVENRSQELRSEERGITQCSTAPATRAEWARGRDFREQFQSDKMMCRSCSQLVQTFPHPTVDLLGIPACLPQEPRIRSFQSGGVEKEHSLCELDFQGPKAWRCMESPILLLVRITCGNVHQLAPGNLLREDIIHQSIVS
jgi:hypothetical protein